ncbi:MAG: hypothetical protein ABFE01_02835 [Phycisphaerales bacterium]
MRDIHRNPILYYLLIPALIGIWPAVVWLLWLPTAQKEFDNDCKLFADANGVIVEILRIDPNPDPNRIVGEFAYGKAVDRAANLCAIPAGSHRYTAQDIMNVGGKKRRDGRVTLKDVSIVQTAKFLSLMQSTWVNLQCDGIDLTRRKGMPDQWEVDISFIYYY